MTAYDYKIDFSDVRREKEMTFFVFPRRYVPVIQRWLTNSGIGGWEFKSIKDARPYLPDNFEIPVVQSKSDPYPITEPKYLMVFLSFYNADDLRAKFEYMTESLDAANLSLAMGDEREAFRQSKEREDETWYRDPPPTSGERLDKAQFTPAVRGNLTNLSKEKTFKSSYDYKIDFSDVRREKEMTFFFFPRWDIKLVRRWLTNSGIGGWEIMRLKQAEAYFPKGMTIPPVYSDEMSEPITDPKYIVVFVSFYNTDDLKAKFEYMTSSPDAFNLIYVADNEHEAMRKAHEQEERTWFMDPPPTSSLRKDKSQFDPGGTRKV